MKPHSVTLCENSLKLCVWLAFLSHSAPNFCQGKRARYRGAGHPRGRRRSVGWVRLGWAGLGWADANGPRAWRAGERSFHYQNIYVISRAFGYRCIPALPGDRVRMFRRRGRGMLRHQPPAVSSSIAPVSPAKSCTMAFAPAAMAIGPYPHVTKIDFTPAPCAAATSLE